MKSAFFRTLAREAAAGYPGRDRFARYFAYGKLTRDPAFEHFLREGLIPDGARVLDLGCGQALVAALLKAARARLSRGDWPPDWPPPPVVAAYDGVELRTLDVERARAMAEAAWRFTAGDIRSTPLPPASLVVILDVLHYIDYDAQAQVLRRVRESLSPRGTLLLRVGDESRSVRFRYTLLIDRLSSALRGLRLPRLWCRPVSSWKDELEGLGFRVHAQPLSGGTPFANVLIVASYDGST